MAIETTYDASSLAAKSRAERIAETPRYMASHKGATGPVCDTPIDAATAFGARYPKARACTVRPVSEVPGSDVVTVTYRGPSYEYVMRKGAPHVAPHPN